MAKRDRHGTSRNAEARGGVARAVPTPVLRGAQLVLAEARKTGHMQLKLPDSGYRHLDQFDVNGNRIETGSVGSTRPVRRERVQQLFKFAALFAAGGGLETQSFDPKSEGFKPVTVKTREHNVDGYLIYMPRGMAQYTKQGTSFSPNSFTTGVPILSEGEPSISFVTSDDTVRPAERAMSTATGIMQNRYIVEGVTFGRGKAHTDTLAVNPFQEAIANGVGNASGAIILGWTYEKYLDYLHTYERSTPLWGGSTKGMLRTTQFIAPHLMLGEATYDQLAAGELPTDPQLIPRQPIKGV
jgi:hypothetical protein